MQFNWSWWSFVVGAATSSAAWAIGMWKTVLEIRKLRQERNDKEEQSRIGEVAEKIIAIGESIRATYPGGIAPMLQTDELAQLCGASRRDTTRALALLEQQGVVDRASIPNHWCINS